MAKKLKYKGTTLRTSVQPVHHYEEEKKSNAGWWIFFFIVILLVIGANTNS